ncbi:hypothetical protein [Ochrobactrum sp. A-1]|uniref:hypothetical protein n=1 Tax=Ochrobactrum sp. A-1 TaxID=2920940 RepID=UPI001F0AD33B|nr:hypothetical protein [Ochrobactrum sp. A-1]
MSYVNLEKDRLENLLIDAENALLLRRAKADQKANEAMAKEEERRRKMGWFRRVFEFIDEAHPGYLACRDMDLWSANQARICINRDLTRVRKLNTILKVEGNLTLSVETYQFLMRACDEQ